MTKNILTYRPFTKPFIVWAGDTIHVEHDGVRLFDYQVTVKGTALGYVSNPYDIIWSIDDEGKGYLGPIHLEPGTEQWLDEVPEKQQCPECFGKGEIELFTSRDPCELCSGNGEV